LENVSLTFDFLVRIPQDIAISLQQTLDIRMQLI